MGNFLKTVEQISQTPSSHNKTVEKKILLYGEQKSGLDSLLDKLIYQKTKFTLPLDEKLENINSQTGIYYANNTRLIYKYDFSHEKTSLQNKWDIIMVVFDMSNPTAIENLYVILSHIEGFNDIVLVANKTDVPNCSENATMLNDLPIIYDYFEVSAKTGDGIVNLLEYIHKK